MIDRSRRPRVASPSIVFPKASLASFASSAKANPYAMHFRGKTVVVVLEPVVAAAFPTS
jgi:hypothetical protein